MGKFDKWVLTPAAVCGVACLIYTLWTGQLGALDKAIVTFLMTSMAVSWGAKYFEPEYYDCTCGQECPCDVEK